jgi:putative transposase
MLIGLYAGYRDRGDIRLHGYAVMPDHYHVLVTLVKEPSVSELVRKIHSALARRARQASFHTGRLWQRRFYDHVIRDEREWRRRLAYIHHNPAVKGLVEAPDRYSWSSASFWLTGTGPVRCDGVTW